MAVIPFAGAIIVPLGLFSGLYSLLTGHLPLAGMNQYFADLFVGMVSFFSRMPFAEIHFPAPSLLWILMYLTFLFSLAFSFRERMLARLQPFEMFRQPRRSLILTAAVSGTGMVLLLALSIMPRQHTMVSFPDVGQGDSSLIELSSGKTILIDAGGTRDNRFDIGRRVVAPFLWNRGIRQLDLVVLSHPHPDHMNGLGFLLDKFPVKEIWTHRHDPELPGYGDLNRLIAEKHIPHRMLSAGDGPVMMGSSEVSILHPDATSPAYDRKTYVAENNRSLVLQIRDRGKVFLFPGDIGERVEDTLLENQLIERCDILKVPHHGSPSSSSELFVAAAHPAIAVMTVGADNPYHHPADEVIARYEGVGSQICRTDKDGAITISLDANDMKIMRWKMLMLDMIRLENPAGWLEQEKKNARRLWLRRWEI